MFLLKWIRWLQVHWESFPDGQSSSKDIHYLIFLFRVRVFTCTHNKTNWNQIFIAKLWFTVKQLIKWIDLLKVIHLSRSNSLLFLKYFLKYCMQSFTEQQNIIMHNAYLWEYVHNHAF